MTGRDEGSDGREYRGGREREDGRFVCGVCGAEFDCEAALRDHVFSEGQVY